MATFFSEHFGIDKPILDAYGAFDISLINDLPLFIDPFLLFHSEKEEYQALHRQIIDYLIFLRNKAAGSPVDKELLSYWYCFPEVKQNWFGFSLVGNGGTGLGMEFAEALHGNLNVIFSDFGDERVTEGSHLEKVCLSPMQALVATISATSPPTLSWIFSAVTRRPLPPSTRGRQRTIGHHQSRPALITRPGSPGSVALTHCLWVDGDYVLLTPRDMLTRDENWINKSDLISDYENIPTAIPDGELSAACRLRSMRRVPAE